MTCEPVTQCLPSPIIGSPEVMVKHFTTIRKISGYAKTNCHQENGYLDSDSCKLNFLKRTKIPTAKLEPIKDDSTKVSVLEIQDGKPQSKDGSKSNKYNDCEPIVPPRINRKKSMRHKKCIVVDPNSVWYVTFVWNIESNLMCYDIISRCAVLVYVVVTHFGPMFRCIPPKDICF